MKQPWLAALLAASILTLCADSARGQWTWQYPTPQGNNLSDVTFLNDNFAIAVGDLGTIMTSYDSGLTWKALFRTNSVATKLTRIDRVDDLSAVAVGDAGVILKTTTAGIIWTTVPSGTTASLRDVSFAGGTGIAVGGSVMLRSTDSGDTWSPVAGAPSPVYAVDMASALVGYCRTATLVYKTTNGGLTWSVLPSVPALSTSFHTPISFQNESDGIVTFYTGDSFPPNAYVTHNGGSSWTARTIKSGFSETSTFVTDIEYRSSSNVVSSVVESICDTYTGSCQNYGRYYRSANDGATWNIDWATRAMNGVAMSNPGVVLTVGDMGVIHRSIGPSDFVQVAGTALSFIADDTAQLAFHDNDTGMVISSQWDKPLRLSGVLHTTVGGSIWELSYWGLDYYGSIQDVAFPVGSTDAYALGTQQPTPAPQVSLILKSTDNGGSWSPIWTGTQDLQLRALEFGSASHGVAVGPAGKALVIDGATVTPVTIPTAIQGVAFADASTAVAVGIGATVSRVMRSADGGSTWSPVVSPAALYVDVDFATPSIGVTVGVSGAIARTIDGGITWTSVTSPTSSTLRAVSIDAAGYGMAVGDGGTVIETSNAGMSWSYLASAPPTNTTLTDVVVFGAQHALVAGPEMTVLEYRENTIPTLFASFKAVPREFGAELSWNVSTDEKLASFSVLRTSGTDQRVIAPGLPISARSFVDRDLVPGQRYQYELLAFDKDGSYTQSPRATVMVPAAAAELLPNQPNPFNPVTTIRFVVPEKMRVTISVHDVAGRVVATLLDDVREPGSHEITWNANGMASGVYFARMHAGKTDVSQKMVLLK
ncbi:MAG TPA: YCF48-related protein [Candidatus Krumholzibacteria bacterium]|nr:YCF48-related protein [Candidatus Krumholzibacteria bacterium]